MESMPMTTLNLFSSEVNPGLQLHHWTRLAPGATPAQPGPTVAWADRVLPARGELIGVATAQPSTSYQATFLARRSTRAYAERQLELATVLQLLRLSRPATADGAAVLLPLALDVAGLPAGAYRFVPAAGALAPLVDADPRPLLREYCYQAEFVAAPLVILLASSLGGHLEHGGDRAYRRMLIETGQIIQHLYLACAALGLAGSVTGSLIQPPIAEWLGLDGYAGTVLLAFAVGAMGGTSHE
jgi:SagB-type dehydrogenase family enzyme